MTELPSTAAAAVEPFEVEKAEDTVSGGAHKVDGFNLILVSAGDPMGNSEEY